ncbi:MAG: hypothetical protein ABT21_06865 [Thiobacillus sp. SCN 65-179]|nr:MAG: hypothetical protein ABT21_06865 [Thiobacillus sp. SCN 65-179]
MGLPQGIGMLCPRLQPGFLFGKLCFPHLKSGLILASRFIERFITLQVRLDGLMLGRINPHGRLALTLLAHLCLVCCLPLLICRGHAVPLFRYW